MLSLCIDIQRKSTARIQDLKSKTRGLLMCAQKKLEKEKSNSMADPKTKEKRFSKLVLPFEDRNQ